MRHTEDGEQGTARRPDCPAYRTPGQAKPPLQPENISSQHAHAPHVPSCGLQSERGHEARMCVRRRVTPPQNQVYAIALLPGPHLFRA